LLCAIYVRTGALRAAIFVHFIANAALWYPLLGQFVIPASNHGIGSWWFNLVCLGPLPVGVAVYVALAARTTARQTS